MNYTSEISNNTHNSFKYKTSEKTTESNNSQHNNDTRHNTIHNTDYSKHYKLTNNIYTGTIPKRHNFSNRTTKHTDNSNKGTTPQQHDFTNKTPRIGKYTNITHINYSHDISPKQQTGKVQNNKSTLQDNFISQSRNGINFKELRDTNYILHKTPTNQPDILSNYIMDASSTDRQSNSIMDISLHTTDNHFSQRRRDDYKQHGHTSQRLHVSNEKWGLVKSRYFELRNLTIKVIKQQTHKLFLQHCVYHKKTPTGLISAPPCPDIIKAVNLSSTWDSNIDHFRNRAINVLIKSLLKSSSVLLERINSIIAQLKEILNELDFNEIMNVLCSLRDKVFYNQCSVKYKKLQRLCDCSSFKFKIVNRFRVTVSDHCATTHKKHTKNRRFKRPQIHEPKSIIYNLSRYSLTTDEESLLQKGLKFCPKPNDIDKTQINVDTTKFIRRMRLKEFWSHENDQINEDNYDSESSRALQSIFPHQLGRQWTPKTGRNEVLDQFCSNVKTGMSNIKCKYFQDNLTKGERLALHSLRNNKDIIIKNADKGGMIVIQNKCDYITACDLLLRDNTFYDQKNIDQTKEFQEELKKILSEGTKHKYITDKLKLGLSNPNPQPGRFYTLPKIHKDIRPPPGRPIVSCVNTVTEQISHFVDIFLQEHVPTLHSYIKDTTDFLCKLENVKKSNIPLNSNTLLIVLDVVSLYTKIPQSEGKAACRQYLDTRKNKKVPTEWIMTLIDFILTRNNFTFNGKQYLQIQGTAMGTKMAPSYANLFMGILEQTLLSGAPSMPHTWLRYIDDIFIIWNNGREEWDRFYDYLNRSHPTIKFTSTVTTENISFLDVNIQLKNGIIKTDLYTKPSDSHNYLNWKSCHPIQCKKGLAFSLALRLRRICSDQEDFDRRCRELYTHLKDRGFPWKNITEAIQKANSLDRQHTLLYNPKKTLTRVPFAITYHPNLMDLPQKLHTSHKNILLKSQTCKIIFKEPPLTAFRRPANLKNFLVKASLPAERVVTTAVTKGFQFCGKTCVIHKYFTPSKQFQSSVNNTIYFINQHINCNTRNIIYLITCTKPHCQKQYIGQSGRSLKARNEQHISKIKTLKKNGDKETKKLYNHFNLPDHNVSHVSIKGIEICLKEDTRYREARERHWIKLIQPELNA